MISGHDDLRVRQRVQERASLFELMRSRTLRQVAGNGDNIGFQVIDSANERGDDRFVDAAEVNVERCTTVLIPIP